MHISQVYDENAFIKDEDVIKYATAVMRNLHQYMTTTEQDQTAARHAYARRGAGIILSPEDVGAVLFGDSREEF